MLKRKIIELIGTIIIGIAFILLGALVPASSLILWLLRGLGIMMIFINAINLIITRINLYEIINSLIGIILGALIIAFPSNVLAIIIIVYLVIIPLINIFYFRKLWLTQDIIKIILGFIFLLFTQFFYDMTNSIISVFLIGLGIIIILGAIFYLGFILHLKKVAHNVTKKGQDVSNDDVDFDFSDKN